MHCLHSRTLGSPLRARSTPVMVNSPSLLHASTERRSPCDGRANTVRARSKQGEQRKVGLRERTMSGPGAAAGTTAFKRKRRTDRSKQVVHTSPSSLHVLLQRGVSHRRHAVSAVARNANRGERDSKPNRTSHDPGGPSRNAGLGFRITYFREDFAAGARPSGRPEIHS